jgi:hypothetical protein
MAIPQMLRDCAPFGTEGPTYIGGYDVFNFDAALLAVGFAEPAGEGRWGMRYEV